jgi:hypothetical protein
VSSVSISTPASSLTASSTSQRLVPSLVAVTGRSAILLLFYLFLLLLTLHLLQYAIITETFEMRIPGSAAVRAGLAGEVKAFQGDGDEQEEGKEVSEALGQK